MTKSFSQYMAETGQQSTLDALGKSGGLSAAESAYNSSGSYGGSSGSSGGGGVSTPEIAQIWDDPAKLDNYLEGYQSKILGQIGNSDTPTAKPAIDPATGQPLDSVNNSSPTGNKSGVSYSQIASQLTPNTDMPAPLDRAKLFDQMRQDRGVDGLESNLNDLKAQADALDAQTRTNVSAERGKPVAQNIVEGRVGVQKQQAQEQMDFINRQIHTVTDQLNTAYNVIGMYMNFASLDYQDAVTRYNTEFSQSLQIFDMLRSVRTDAISELKMKTDVQFQKADLQMRQHQQQEDSARANLQIMANAITSGNLNPASISPDQKAALNKLEVQSGLPIGFTSSLGLSNKDKILFTSTNNGVTQVGIQNPDGTVSVKNYGTPTGRAATESDKKIAISQAVVGKLNSVKGQDGFVNGSAYKTAKQWYVSQGGQANDFDSNYSVYANPQYARDYGIADSALNPDKYKTQPL